MNLATTAQSIGSAPNPTTSYIPAWPYEGEGEEPPMYSVDIAVVEDRVTISTFDEYTDNMNTTSLNEEEVTGLITRLQQALEQMRREPRVNG